MTIDMNTEQERDALVAIAREIVDLHAKRKVVLTVHVEALEEALAANEAALQSQPQETIAYVTRNEEGDPAMLFFDLKEARLYCNPDEEPEALVLAGSARRIEENEQ